MLRSSKTTRTPAFTCTFCALRPPRHLPSFSFSRASSSSSSSPSAAASSPLALPRTRQLHSSKKSPDQDYVAESRDSLREPYDQPPPGQLPQQQPPQQTGFGSLRGSGFESLSSTRRPPFGSGSGSGSTTGGQWGLPQQQQRAPSSSPFGGNGGAATGNQWGLPQQQQQRAPSSSPFGGNGGAAAGNQWGLPQQQQQRAPLLSPFVRNDGATGDQWGLPQQQQQRRAPASASPFARNNNYTNNGNTAERNVRPLFSGKGGGPTITGGLGPRNTVGPRITFGRPEENHPPTLSAKIVSDRFSRPTQSNASPPPPPPPPAFGARTTANPFGRPTENNPPPAPALARNTATPFGRSAENNPPALGARSTSDLFSRPAESNTSPQTFGTRNTATPFERPAESNISPPPPPSAYGTRNMASPLGRPAETSPPPPSFGVRNTANPFGRPAESNPPALDARNTSNLFSRPTQSNPPALGARDTASPFERPARGDPPALGASNNSHLFSRSTESSPPALGSMNTASPFRQPTESNPPALNARNTSDMFSRPTESSPPGLGSTNTTAPFRRPTESSPLALNARNTSDMFSRPTESSPPGLGSTNTTAPFGRPTESSPPALNARNTSDMFSRPTESSPPGLGSTNTTAPFGRPTESSPPALNARNTSNMFSRPTESNPPALSARDAASPFGRPAEDSPPEKNISELFGRLTGSNSSRFGVQNTANPFGRPREDIAQSFGGRDTPSPPGPRESTQPSFGRTVTTPFSPREGSQPLEGVVASSFGKPREADPQSMSEKFASLLRARQDNAQRAPRAQHPQASTQSTVAPRSAAPLSAAPSFGAPNISRTIDGPSLSFIPPSPQQPAKQEAPAHDQEMMSHWSPQIRRPTRQDDLTKQVFQQVERLPFQTDRFARDGLREQSSQRVEPLPRSEWVRNDHMGQRGSPFQQDRFAQRDQFPQRENLRDQGFRGGERSQLNRNEMNSRFARNQGLRETSVTPSRFTAPEPEGGFGQRTVDRETPDRGVQRDEAPVAPARWATSDLPEVPAGKPVDPQYEKRIASRGRDRSRHRQFDNEESAILDEDEGMTAKEARKLKKAKQRQKEKKAAEPIPLFIPQFISVESLASMLNVRMNKFSKQLQELGFDETSHDHILNAETAGLIAQEYGYEPIIDKGDSLDLKPRPAPEDKSSVPSRPPVVTIMGHVDHGKTTLLDWLRKSSVVASEHGGITQHIGAFSVTMPSGKVITFLDTPGHAAFLSMRERGANVTDIVILVVAADDSVKPQTIEAIKHAKAANVPMIVAINKVDKPDSDIERVKLDLGRWGVEVEDFGGDVQTVCVSGKTGQGMESLEEATVTLGEILDHRAETDGLTEGWVLEATTKRRGRVATVLVTRGTLRPGDVIIAGTTWARVRTLMNEHGVEIESAPPGTPVEVDGWKDQPEAGDQCLGAPSEDRAKTAVEYRAEKAERIKQSVDMDAMNKARQERRAREEEEEAIREAARRDGTDPDEAVLQAQRTVARGEARAKKDIEVPFIIKADVAGSAEAVVDSVSALGNDEVRPKVLRGSFGAVSEFDVDHAAAAEAYILAFNVVTEPSVLQYARAKKVTIIADNVIYRLVESATEKLSDRLPPLITTRVLGEAEILEVFAINIRKKVYKPVAGCRVKNGNILRNARVRVLRNGKEVWSGSLESLKNVKEDVLEMRKGSECGMGFAGWGDFKKGDAIQCYEVLEQKRTL